MLYQVTTAIKDFIFGTEARFAQSFPFRLGPSNNPLPTRDALGRQRFVNARLTLRCSRSNLLLEILDQLDV